MVNYCAYSLIDISKLRCLFLVKKHLIDLGVLKQCNNKFVNEICDNKSTDSVIISMRYRKIDVQVAVMASRGTSENGFLSI